MPQAPKDLQSMSSLLQIVSDLRGPSGCPWDKEQDHLSLAPYAIEEVAELAEALESRNDTQTKEELGDVLFQVALHCQLAQERSAFTFQDVLEALNEKMIRRHPHVFSNVIATSTEEVWKNWDEIKKKEKADKKQNSKILDVPVALPALQRSAKIGQRTQKLKFDWDNAEQVLEKVREELIELEEAIDEQSTKALKHELGDLLFSIAQLARHLGFDPEQSLRDCNRRFEHRFETMIRECERQGLVWGDLNNHQKEDLWSEAKRQTASSEA